MKVRATIASVSFTLIAVSVVGAIPSARAGQDLIIAGDFVVSESGPMSTITTAVPATTTTTTAVPTSTTTTTGPGAGSSYPGRPPAGQVLWGAVIGQNDDPKPRHEDPTGVSLSIRRTFFQWNHRTGYMINTARADVAAGRLPWVSTKTPSWAAMAAGDHDAEIDQMLRALGSIPGPVWLTVHHEPEGGGGVNAPDDPAGPAGHLAMNRRVRQRMDALGVDNVALLPILMEWTWHPESGRNHEDWWDPSVYDLMGVDHYVCMDDAPSCREDSLLNGYWDRVIAWAAAEGVDLAVGEWGLRGTDQAAGDRVAEWFNHAANSYRTGARIVALSAFDSNANGDLYELKGKQLEMYRALMLDPRTARITD